jgi:hypothetical protein
MSNRVVWRNAIQTTDDCPYYKEESKGDTKPSKQLFHDL